MPRASNRPPSALAACTALLTSLWAAGAGAQPAPAPSPPAEVAPVIQPAPPAQPDTAASPAPAPAPVIPEGPPPPETPPPPPLAPETQPPVAPPQAPLPQVFAYPPDLGGRPKLDLLMPFASTSLALGGVLVLGGVIQQASSAPEEYCGLSGCVERPNRLPVNIMGNLVGAGTGLAVVGAVGLLEWGIDTPKGDEYRKNVPMMLSGFTATAMSGASLGLAIGNGLTYGNDGANFETGWPFFLSSAVLAGVGIPLWAIGARKSTPAKDEERRVAKSLENDLLDASGKPKIRSRGMMIAGSILTALGGTTMIAGTGVMLWDVTSDYGGGYVALLIGAPMIGGGAIFSSIGIPLLVVGTRPRRPKPVADASDSALPEINAGPTSVQATWRFE